MWDSAEIQDFSLALNNQEQVDSTLLDMSKAINTDLHKCLCYRLFHYGIHGIPLMWIRNVSSDRAQKYILNGQPSNSTNVISGIPQGLVLGLFYLSCVIIIYK